MSVFPYEPMLASAAAGLPGSLHGGVAFEPKFDGWRAIWHRDVAGARMWSRQGHDLTDCFPDIAEAVCDQVRPGTTLDGELVVWRNGRIDFTALSERMTQRRRCAALAAEFPATFMAFDLVQEAGEDVRRHTLRARRASLEELSEQWAPPLQLTPQTRDPEVAERWMADYAAADVGIEGVMAKGLGQTYRGGVRGWRKVRIRHTREAVVGAVLGSPLAPGALVVGLPSLRGDLQVAGVTLPLTAAQSADVAARLTQVSSAHPWPVDLRWSAFGAEPVPVTRVGGSLVVELSADTAFERGRWRHPTRFLRCRPDLCAEDVATLAEPTPAA